MNALSRKQALNELSLVQVEQAVTFKDAATQPYVGKTNDAFPVERESPALQLFDATSREGGADHRSHRATGDKSGRDAMLGQRLEYTDMRPAASGAASEGDANSRSKSHSGPAPVSQLTVRCRKRPLRSRITSPAR